MGMKDDYLVVCPYYIEDLPQADKRRIVCEGVSGASQLRLVFDDKESYREHKLTFCRNIDGFYNCPVCKVLAAKYADD